MRALGGTVCTVVPCMRRVKRATGRVVRSRAAESESVGVGSFDRSRSRSRSRSRFQYFFIISLLVKMETEIETEHKVRADCRQPMVCRVLVSYRWGCVCSWVN